MTLRYLIVLMIMLLPLQARAEEQASLGIVSGQPESMTETISPDGYCGLYCVFAIARMNSMPVEFSELLSKNFLSGQFGSTADDLINALRTCGLRGEFSETSTIDRLRRSKHPVILHVRPAGFGTTYSHWVLFLGFQPNNRIRIYDPPNDEADLSVAELLAIWDNATVEVFASRVAPAPNTDSALQWIRLPETFTLLMLLVVAVLLAVVSKRFSAVASILITTSFAILVAHWINPAGFAWSPTSVRGIIDTHFPPPHRHLSYTEVVDLIHSGDILLIDARRTRDFARGHIPGAVNVPIDANSSTVLTAVKKSQELRGAVVYCNGKDCSWANHVAGKLTSRGAQNVYVYDGGIKEWTVNSQTLP